MNDSKTKLEKALTEMHQRENEYANACVAAADAEAEYRIQFAKEFLKADGSVDARKSIATDKCEKYLRERFRTEAVEKFTREKLRDAQTAASIRQSMFSADYRSDFGHSRRNDVP